MTPNQPHPRILVLDDDPLMLRTIGRALRGMCEVVVAATAREALSLIERDSDFDIILCDVQLPDMTCLQLRQLVAANSLVLAERFVFMTGGDGVAFGLDESVVLNKPFSLNCVRVLITRIAAGDNALVALRRARTAQPELRP